MTPDEPGRAAALETKLDDVLLWHRGAAFGPSAIACDKCDRWMLHDEYRAHIVALQLAAILEVSEPTS